MKIATLHLCNLDERESFTEYQELIAADDAVIFYAKKISENLQNQLLALFAEIEIYFVSAGNIDNYVKWVELVDSSQRTLTWK